METPPAEVWTHPSLEVRASPISGRGLFTTSPLDAGVVVIRLGGRLVSTAELHELFAAGDDGEYVDTLAVGVDTHVVLPPGTVAHHGNHCCEPNLWPVGAYELATRQPVAADEELTSDYGTTSDDPTFRMTCSCGAASCRGVVTGEDWRLPELQRREAGHWAPGLQQRISRDRGPAG